MDYKVIEALKVIEKYFDNCDPMHCCNCQAQDICGVRLCDWDLSELEDGDE